MDIKGRTKAMKKIKYLILVIILICGFLLSGELYQDYLNSFANVCDYTTLYSENQEAPAQLV